MEEKKVFAPSPVSSNLEDLFKCHDEMHEHPDERNEKFK